MDDERDISKLYKNKETLDKDQVTILQQIDATGDIDEYRLLYDISDFERQNYWESAINRFDENQKTAMHYCIDLLIAAHPHRPKNARPVRLDPWRSCVKNENPWNRAVRIFLVLINAGASVNIRKIHQYDIHTTPLEYAICENAPRDVLELLIKYGAYVNGFEFCCHTPLMTAIYFCDVDAVEVLLAAGADPNARYEDGAPLLQQVLHQIYSRYDFAQCKKMIELLLKYGANPNMLGYDMETCVEYGCWEYVGARFLKEKERGISRGMIELRKLFKKYARNFPAPKRSRARYIRKHTFISRLRQTRDTSRAERAYAEIENTEYLDRIMLHLLNNTPIPPNLIRRVIRGGVDINACDELRTLCDGLNGDRKTGRK